MKKYTKTQLLLIAVLAFYFLYALTARMLYWIADIRSFDLINADLSLLIHFAIFLMSIYLIQKVFLQNKEHIYICLRKENSSLLASFVFAFILFLLLTSFKMLINPILLNSVSSESLDKFVSILTGSPIPSNLGHSPVDFSPMRTVILFLFIVVVGPIFEELLFRGVFIGVLHQRLKLPLFVSALLPLLLCTWMHSISTFPALITYMLSFSVFTLIYLKKDLITSIFVHALSNFFVFILGFISS